jgi:hypothetical protein
MSTARFRPARTGPALAALALLTLLASGCAAATEVTDQAKTVANSAEVCTKATAEITASVAEITRLAQQADIGRAQEDLATELRSLHEKLQPLSEKAADAEVKASLEALDTAVAGWAEDPTTFVRTGQQRIDRLVGGVTSACTPGN